MPHTHTSKVATRNSGYVEISSKPLSQCIYSRVEDPFSKHAMGIKDMHGARLDMQDYLDLKIGNVQPD